MACFEGDGFIFVRKKALGNNASFGLLSMCEGWGCNKNE